MYTQAKYMPGNSGPAKSKGCKTCERRRIKCDLGQPHCRKCRDRSLECPGYGRTLKWVGGVAARGHLRTRPAPRPAPAVGTPDVTDHAIVSSGSSGSTFGSATETQLFTDHLSAVLLDYYDRKIAGLMVWLDSDQNEYRRRAVPLARSQPGLFFAIMALSAHHGSFLLDNGENLSEYAHNMSLAKIQQFTGRLAHHLRDGSMETLDNEIDIANMEWVLASSMIMSNYNMMRSLPGASECHRRAAKVLVHSFKSTKARDSEFFNFLWNQLAICDIVAATTSFISEDIIGTVTLSSYAGDGIFTDYLSFLHRITLERYHLPGSQPNSSGGPKYSASSIREAFEQARGATLMAAGRRPIASESSRFDFIRLVDVYHSAGLLYAYRTLGIKGTDELARLQHDVLAGIIVEQLISFEDRSSWAHNLPWPAFIAGVEAYGDQRRQSVTEALFTDIVNCTGFSRYIEALDFLREFWRGTDPDWRPLAEQWETAGRRILLY